MNTMKLLSEQKKVLPENHSSSITSPTKSPKAPERGMVGEQDFSKTLEKISRENKKNTAATQPKEVQNLEEIKSTLHHLLQNPEAQTPEAVEKLLQSLFAFLHQGTIHLQDSQKAPVADMLASLKDLFSLWEKGTLTTEEFLNNLMAWLDASQDTMSFLTPLGMVQSSETSSNINTMKGTTQKIEDKLSTNTGKTEMIPMIRVVDKRNVAAEKPYQESLSSKIELLIKKLETHETSSFSEVNLSNSHKPIQDFGVKVTASLSSLPRVSIEQMLQQVAGKALITLRDGQSEMRLQLTPPDLGRMEMKIILEDGQMMGKIVVSTPEAKALFDQNLGELQRQLQQAGVHVGNLDVSLGQPGGEHNDDTFFPNKTGFLSEGGEVMSPEEVRNTFLWSDSHINYIV